jgi:hypothetical protein
VLIDGDHRRRGFLELQIGMQEGEIGISGMSTRDQSFAKLHFLGDWYRAATVAVASAS